MKAYFVYLTKPSASTPDRLSGVRLMARLLAEAGYDRSQCKSVYLVEGEWGSKKPSAKDLEANRPRFLSEIGTEPCILVAMGASAMGPLTKNIYPISLCRGEPVPTTDKLPYPKGSLIYGMFDPLQVWNDMGVEDLFRRDIRHLVALMKGAPEQNPKVDSLVVHTAEEVDHFRDTLDLVWEAFPEEERFFVVDTETQGRNWLEPGHYIRTIQVGYAPGMALTIELYKEHPDFTQDFKSEWLKAHPDEAKAYLQEHPFDNLDSPIPRTGAKRKAKVRELLANPVCCCPDLEKMWKSVKALLQDSRIPIIGQNIIYDWQWLLSFGVDIRDNVFYDTMLAEHLINSDGPFRLDEIAMRRTSWGRYNTELDLWVHHHKDFCSEGYGAIPSCLLIDYGGADVDCPRSIMKAQLPILESYGMTKPRGPNGEYPSLLDSTLLNELATDELEQNGLPIDRKRLTELIDAYQGMRAQLLSEITLMAAELGMPNFNPNAQAQMKMLLFGKLGLAPVKTTDGQVWGEAVGSYDMGSDEQPSAATDKTVLEMLQNEHPIVKKILQFKRIDQACKTWLRHPDEETGEGGLEAQLWADGKLHSHFLPTTSTGRYRTSDPNCFPAEVEVLTSKGWLSWDEAYAKKDDPTLLLAQWDLDTKTRDISFVRPEEWIKSEGELVRFSTRLYVDIVCTPNHRFEVYHRKTGKSRCVTADQLDKCGEYLIPQCGNLVLSPGTQHLSGYEASLLCATQADGHIVKVKCKGVASEFGVEYALTKERKTTRVRTALDTCGIQYRESHDLNAIGNPRTRFYIGKKCKERVFSSFKIFHEGLLGFDAETIKELADEVFLWDGTVRDGWRNYSSAIKNNADWVQTLQILSGRRARPRVYTNSIGSVSYQVDSTDASFAALANGKLEHLEGRHTVYCATMPKGTIIVRFNGKVTFSRNCQNFPKRADGYLKEIFGEDRVPPMLRTIVAPPEGWMMMEGDFKQAELFTLANISGDPDMIRLLTTPGLDLHDHAAINSFKLRMLDEADNEVFEDDLIKLASKVGAESEEFEHFMKVMRYIQVNGEILSRSAFKSGIRVAAKSISFGVPYGRSGRAIAIAIKAETGMPTPLKELEVQCNQMVEAWKTETFPVAWQYLVKCQQAVYDPGYVENPWGFRKTFHVRPGVERKDLEREAGNFPIQSTVAQTVNIAADLIRRYRREHGMKFKIQNQIHDAIMLELPIEEKDECMKMFQETLAAVKIPLGNGKYFQLGCDVDLYERWGVKCH